MQNVVFTQLSIPEFRALVREELEKFHQSNSAQAPRQTAHRPDQASQTHAEKRAISKTQKQSA